MAGAEDPATLSGLCQAMAIAMVGGRCSSGQGRMRLSSRKEVRAKLSSMMITRFWSVGRRHPYWSASDLAQGLVVLSDMPWDRDRVSQESIQWQTHVDENIRFEGWTSSVEGVEPKPCEGEESDEGRGGLGCRYVSERVAV